MQQIYCSPSFPAHCSAGLSLFLKCCFTSINLLQQRHIRKTFIFPSEVIFGLWVCAYLHACVCVSFSSLFPNLEDQIKKSSETQMRRQRCVHWREETVKGFVWIIDQTGEIVVVFTVTENGKKVPYLLCCSAKCQFEKIRQLARIRVSSKLAILNLSAGKFAFCQFPN